jgi:class 3 adenylate cyclase
MRLFLKIIAIIICILADSYILIGGQSTIDSLLQSYALSNTVYQKTEALKYIHSTFTDLYRDKKYVADSILSFSNTLIPIAKEERDTASLAAIYRIKSDVFYIRHMIDSTIKYLEKSMKLYQESNNRSGYANCCLWLRLPYLKLNKVNIAISYLFRAIKEYEILKDTAQLYDCYFQLGHTYFYQNRSPEKVIEYMTRFNIVNEDPTRACFIAEAYLRLNKPDSALYYLNIGSAVLKSGLPIQIPYYHRAKAAYFYHMHRSDSAKVYYSNALKGLENVQQQHNSVQLFYNLGNIAFIEKKYNEAITYYLKAEKYALKYNRYFDLADIYTGLSKVYEAEHQYEKAFQMLKKYHSVEDSSQKAEAIDAMVAAELKHKFSAEEAKLKEDKLRQEFEIAALMQQRKNTITMASGIILFLAIFAIVFFFQRMKIARQKKVSDELLLNILPQEVADELKEKGRAEAKYYESVSVLFTDFKSFTTISQQLTPQELVNELHECFEQFDKICEKYNIEKIKTIGDAYLAVGGLPDPDPQHAINVAWAALEILEFMNKRSLLSGKNLFEIRIGINSGSVVAGIVGVKKFAYDIWGDAVNTAARMESHGEPGRIHVSEEFAQKLTGNLTLRQAQYTAQTLSPGEGFSFPLGEGRDGVSFSFPLGEGRDGVSFSFPLGEGRDGVLIPRGEIEIKGKGRMPTYFLESIH